MKAKKFGFGVGIAIILPMMIHYGVSTFQPRPRWQDFQIHDYHERFQSATAEEKNALLKESKALDQKRRALNAKFEQTLFFWATPLGILAIILGAYCSVQAIGAGLIFGGVFTLVDGYFCYWSELQDWMRFVSLLAAFLILLIIGYAKMKDKKI